MKILFGLPTTEKKTRWTRWDEGKKLAVKTSKMIYLNGSHKCICTRNAEKTKTLWRSTQVPECHTDVSIFHTITSEFTDTKVKSVLRTWHLSKCILWIRILMSQKLTDQKISIQEIDKPKLLTVKDSKSSKTKVSFFYSLPQSITISLRQFRGWFKTASICIHFYFLCW